MSLQKTLLLSAMLIASADVRDADACGVKVTVKASNLKKPIPPSKVPSRILVIGDSSRSLGKHLQEAGHKVEAVDTADGAKSTDYRVVMVDDAAKLDEVAQAFPNSDVMVMESRSRDSVAAVEYALRKDGGTAIAVASRRVPINVGGSNPPGARDRPTVASGRGEAEEAEVAVAEAPPPAVVEETPSAEKEEVVAKAEPEPEPEPEPEVVSAPEPKKIEPEPKIEPVTLAVRDADPPQREAPKAARKVVFFGFNSTELGRSAQSTLKNALAWLKANPQGSVRLEGHTDNQGAADYNLTLGERRAEAALKFLLDQGIDENRITAVSEGEGKPVFQPGSHRKNRCVVVKLGSEVAVVD